MPFCERYSFTWSQNIQPGWEYTMILFVIFQPRLGLCRFAASAAWRLSLCRSRDPLDHQRRPVRVAHLATTLQAHKPQCDPTPRLSGCARQAGATEFASDPNIAPLSYPECGR